MKTPGKSVIIVKGPPGCGKSFLFSHFKRKYDGFLAQFHEFTEDTIPKTFEYSFNSSISSITSIAANTSSSYIFPPLQFSLIPPTRNTTSQPSKSKLPTVSRVTDAHFYGRKEAIDDFRHFSGLLWVEVTDYHITADGESLHRVINALKEAFKPQAHVIELNRVAPTIMKRSLLGSIPSQLYERAFSDGNFCGDARALLHDLYLASLSRKPVPTSAQFSRDYRTCFFHYLGKLLYPPKSDERVFDQDSFWDQDLDQLILFSQYYLPRFVTNAADALDSISHHDTISWTIKVRQK